MKIYKRLFQEIKVNVRGGVPIGDYTFKYIPDDKNNISMLVGSAKVRKMKFKVKGDIVIITGDAGGHSSLIDSLGKLGFKGEVTD